MARRKRDNEKPNLPATPESAAELRRKLLNRPDCLNKAMTRWAQSPPTPEVLGDVAFNKAAAIIAMMDDEAIRKASLSQKAIAAGVLIDKSQILKGQPSMVLGYAERKERRATRAALIEELKRRGALVEVTPTPDQIEDEPGA